MKKNPFAIIVEFYCTFGNFDKYTMVHLFWPQDHKAVFDLS